MNRMKIYTSDEILVAEDLCDLQESFCNGLSFGYKMTQEDFEYLDFARGRYLISNWIDDNCGSDDILVFSCPFEMSRALHDDGLKHKAACLSDESALQRLFFWLSLDYEQVEDFYNE